ncbi:MAG: hypothetical protein JSR64_10635 [Nitrospira sp.]|nr:hypothetical protein [Nitrospira sp.]
MHPMELVEWLQSDEIVDHIGPSITALVGDYASRFGKAPDKDRVHEWIFSRLLEEVRAMPASRGRDWILGRWQTQMWPRFRDALREPRYPLAWSPMRFLGWHLAAEIERVCHPRITPEGFLAWLRSEGGDVELNHAWARCAQDNPDFIKACWDEGTEPRLVREVFIARITQGVRCLSPFYLPTIVRWLAFLQAPSTAEDALQVARMPTDEPPIFVSFRLPQMAAWIADRLEALMEASSDGCADVQKQDGSSAADDSGLG